MDNEFYKKIFFKQQIKENVPPNSSIADWALRLIALLFAEFSCNSYTSFQEVRSEFKVLEDELVKTLNATHACVECNNEEVAKQFFEQIPELYNLLTTDIEAIESGDPAARNEFEVIRAYPGFYALCFYRIAHSLQNMNVPLIPRILTEYAHSRTGIDIHPGAEIGNYFCIDHGTGVVIGETAVIGNHVKIYQGVTLGALSINKTMANTKRHPTVEDHVVIYSGATILGGNTVIGHHSIIGGNVWLTQSIPPGSKVYHRPDVIVEEGKILDTVGNTPQVELLRLNNNPRVKIFAKLEGNNPGGSVKDRPAYNMIKSALDRGDIDKNTKLIEATSGNTGIAMALMARLFGIQIELVMPSNSTRERVLTMEAFGAKVILLESIEVCRDYAEQKAETGSYYLLNQFANPDNYLAHYKTTGPEIWKDTEGKITHFVSAMGTTGTIMGTSMYLKEKNPSVQIVGCQPTEESSIPGIRRWPVAYLPKIFDPSRVDRIMDVSQEEATITTRKLASEEGIFAGMSSGGAAAAALRLASELNEGCIVFIVCDRGDRYLSSNLFGN
jgi:cysteine synthase B